MRNESPTPKIKVSEGEDFLTTVREGLRQHPRSIPPKFFYDTRGSQLFDLICKTPEYYPTRTETGILEKFGEQMATLTGKSCVLIELGSGSATKTPLLLKHLHEDAVYVPIDICEPHLIDSTQRLQAMFPEIKMHPLHGDYTHLPSTALDEYSNNRKVLYFPGSTIGNSTPEEALQLLRHAAKLVGKTGAMLIGVDSKKSPEVLNAAYNDANGYTAEFNLNLLEHMRKELGAQIEADGFKHYAYYNATHGRVEMHLVSQRKQDIVLNGERFAFEHGDTIHTENSYKYTALEFQQLANNSGWYPKMLWTDRDNLFNVHYLSLNAYEPRHLPQQLR